MNQFLKDSYPSSTVDVQFIGAKKLMELYHKSIEETLELKLVKSPISLGKNDYLTLVNLGTYFDFITDEETNIQNSFFEAVAMAATWYNLALFTQKIKGCVHGSNQSFT